MPNNTVTLCVAGSTSNGFTASWAGGATSTRPSREAAISAARDALAEGGMADPDLRQVRIAGRHSVTLGEVAGLLW